MASNQLSVQLVNSDPKDGFRRRRIAEELLKLHADGNIKVEAELSEEQKKAWRSIRGKALIYGYCSKAGGFSILRRSNMSGSAAVGSAQREPGG